MNIKQIEKNLLDILTGGEIEANEAKIEAKMLMKHFLKVSDKDFIFNSEISDYSIVEEKARLRAQTKAPIQHIIGHAHFMGEDFIVDKNVLIPRDETEILVRKAIEIVKSKKQKAKSDEPAFGLLPLAFCTESHNALKVLDIGTGTGCIACIVAKLTDAHVIGVDISTDALQIALENASKLELYNKATFRKSDIFSNVNKGFLGDEFFDVIISNPPYIPPSEKINIQEEVKFDPELALFTNDELGVEFYEKIAKEAPSFLNKGGHLIFELGIGQAELVAKLMKKYGFKNIGIEKDLSGIERVIWGNI